MSSPLLPYTQQAEQKLIHGSPEGRFKAPPGYQITDTDTGDLYLKTTRADLNTGWLSLGIGLAALSESVFHANTLAILKAMSPTAFLKAAYLYGVNIPGDTALLSYYWDAASFLPPDDISVIKFNSTVITDPGRLIQTGKFA